MKFSLHDIGVYLQTRKAPIQLIRILTATRKIFDFGVERSNRLTRFVKIVNEYRANVPVDRIAKTYDCSTNTVLRYARIAGIPKRPKTDDPERHRKIIALYQLGKSISEIAAACGCSESLVSKTASAAGIQRRVFKKRKGH